jgi:hypothetical protein
MAEAAYRHAANLASMGQDIIGVGCTCALATDRDRRGEHKVGQRRGSILSLLPHTPPHARTLMHAQWCTHV